MINNIEACNRKKGTLYMEKTFEQNTGVIQENEELGTEIGRAHV